MSFDKSIESLKPNNAKIAMTFVRCMCNNETSVNGNSLNGTYEDGWFRM